MQFEKLKNSLYQNYYKYDLTSPRFSDVTSSHWREFGEKTTVIQGKEGFEIDAYGISGFKKNTILNSLINLPVNYLLLKMLNEYKANGSTVSCAKAIAKKLSVLFNFDHAKHVLIYDLLDSHGVFNTENLICIIGDGHGFFGTLIKSMRPNSKILFVNLGRNLLIDTVCFSKVFPDRSPLLLSGIEDHKEISEHEVIFLEAEKYKILENLPIGLFINVASMQEMDSSMIKTYFKIIETSTVSSYFYCCNREEKLLPDGNLIRFMDYPWIGDLLIDEPCPWYQKYPYPIPPFWRLFDGTHLHRLIKIIK